MTYGDAMEAARTIGEACAGFATCEAMPSAVFIGDWAVRISRREPGPRLDMVVDLYSRYEWMLGDRYDMRPFITWELQEFAERVRDAVIAHTGGLTLRERAIAIVREELGEEAGGGV